MQADSKVKAEVALAKVEEVVEAAMEAATTMAIGMATTETEMGRPS